MLYLLFLFSNLED